jgi:agmatine/peptidylarginine deiminase
MDHPIIFPPEWHPQSGVQLTWPHEGTDWADMLEQVIPCFVRIAHEILLREALLVVAPDAAAVRRQLGSDADSPRLHIYEMPTNDTWARDHGGISVFEKGRPLVYDFVFNGWGLKFAANYDNLINRRLRRAGAFASAVILANKQILVLEGGSIETNGRGTLLTTTSCLTSYNRNDYLSKPQIENKLRALFGLRRVLWLDKGYLAGDDTDGHIDTLARFCSEDSIAYVQCLDTTDEHFGALAEMERELQAFRQDDGTPFRLIPLPMAEEVLWEGVRLPATYANFLVINDAVLLPFYGSVRDEEARAALATAFPTREIIGINCLPLLRQHGSLHCLCMQFPEGFLKI